MNLSSNYNLKSILKRTKSLFASGKFEAVVRLSDAALEIYPKNIEVLNNKRIALSRLFKYKEVKDVFIEIIKINPTLSKYIDELLVIDPENLDALNNKGVNFSSHFKYQEAIEIFDEVLKIDSKNVQALHSKGNAMSGLNKYQEATEIFNEILKVDPKNIDALHSKGSALDQLDKYVEAVKCYDEVLKINPENKWILEQATERKKHILDEMSEWQGVNKHSVREILCEDNKWPHRGNKFRYASEEFRNDKEIVLEAIKYSYNSLKYASSKLRADREVVLTAVNFNGWAIQYATQELQNDREIVLEAVNHNRDVLSIVSPIFQDDAEIVRTAISSEEFQAPFTTILQNASPRLRSNRNIVLQAVKRCGMEIKYANPCFFDDEEIIFTAFENWISPEWGETHGIYTYIPLRLRKKIEKIENKDNSESLTDRLAEKLANLSVYFDDDEKEKRREEKSWKEKEEKEWHIEHKEHQEQWKRDLEEWQSKLVQWRQEQKNNKFENYVKFRAELEKMPIYERWKQDVMKKCGNKCQIDKSHKNRKIEVHHLNSLYSIYIENNLTSSEKIIKCKKLWDVDNGVVLCKECHDKMESSKTRQAMIAKDN